MPSYLRWKLPGATYFFTVITASRRPLFSAPTSRGLLASAFHFARRRFPYDIDAAVLLPDHLHILMRPAENVDYSSLWRLIKTVFTRRLIADASCTAHHDAPEESRVHLDAPPNTPPSICIDSPQCPDAECRVHLDAPPITHRGCAARLGAPHETQLPDAMTKGRRAGEANVWQRRFYEHTFRDESDWGRHVDYIHWNPVKHGYVQRPQDWKWSSIHRFVRRGLQVPSYDTPQHPESYGIPE